MKTSTRKILNYAESFLTNCNVESPRTESEWLVGHILNLSRSDMYLKSDQTVSNEVADVLEEFLKRRELGEPLQYIIGSTEFYNSEILVGPGVLIPRPETELLVDLARNYYEAAGDILDLCTGSGAIALALAKEIPGSCNLIGIDSSEEALRWANRNADRLGISRVQFLFGDLFTPVRGHLFKIITANPPYVSPKEYDNLPICVRDHEPKEALIADNKGLSILTRIAESAKLHLVVGGWLLCEIGETQAQCIRNIFIENSWRNIRIIKDYNNCDRFIVAQK